uniref:Thioredoxin domain containing 16 n=1 Tax=Salvator merianae TaxID=96440 RepID=A0A8D0BK13_SALMN
MEAILRDLVPLQQLDRAKVMFRPRTNTWPLSQCLLLLWASCAMSESNADNLLPELSPQEYMSSLQASKASFVYFQKSSPSPSAEVFLEQLEHSIKNLQDYGISVLKVKCDREEAIGYCREDSASGSAYLFRGHVLLRELPTDALFSVDAIVANVLFALLFNEVKYLATLVDLQKLEDALKGQSDLVFAYVQAVGTAEHRVLMEAAFVYGNLKFALTTEVMLLKSICNEEADVPSSKLFFCHCKLAVDPTLPCRRTLMEQPLTTLSVHKFMKLMGEPLVVEAVEDPESISTIHLQLGLPLIFILTQKETSEVDKRTAEFVAWRLLGKAGVVLLPRSSISRDVTSQPNMALKQAGEGVPVRYLVLKDPEEIVSLVESHKDSEPSHAGEEEEEEYEDEELEEGENYEEEIQDDQVVESVIRDRKHELSLEDIQMLTEDSFAPALAMASYAVVLFYASWEAVSLVVMQSYVEVAARLKGNPELMLARVNCWDWPQVCSQQNITQFPAIRMYTREGRKLDYAAMWGTEEMLRFIELGKLSCPLRLTTPEEVEEYLWVRISPYQGVSVLGIFDTNMSEAKEAFTEAGMVLNGYVVTGIYSEDDATILSHKYNVPLPALLFAKPGTQERSAIHLSNYSTRNLVDVIHAMILEPFPEITIGNLPQYFQLHKPLLILFSDGALHEKDEEEMRQLARHQEDENFIACWLNLKNTPVGKGILKAYFGNSYPALPLLLWISLHTGGQIFVFPSDQTLSEGSVLAWIEKLKSSREFPSGKSAMCS